MSKLRLSARPHWALSLLLGALAAVFALSGCGTGGTASALLVASVNGHGITQGDYRIVQRYYGVSLSQQLPDSAWQSPTGRGSFGTVQGTALDFLINLELMHQQLADCHLSVPAGAAGADRRALQKMIDQQKNNPDPNTQALIRTLTPDMVALLADQQATEAALFKGVSVPGAHVRAILVASKDKASQLQQQAANGADFAQLAQQNSLDAQSGANGGDLGNAYFGQFGQFNDTYDTHLFAGATPAAAGGCYNHNAYAANAGTTHYEILQDGDQYLLFQISELRDRPLSEISDTQLQAAVFGSWLSDTVRSHADISTYLSVPVGQQPKLLNPPQPQG